MNNKKAGDHKKIVLIFLAVAFFFSISSLSVFAANDFASGNYNFTFMEGDEKV